MLVEKDLQDAIYLALQSMQNPVQNSEDPTRELADRLGTAIHSYVIKAQVNPGIAVATAGGPASQTGATTAPGTIS